MSYHIFFICFLLGLASGVIYELIYLARFIILLPTTPKPAKQKRIERRRKIARPQHMPQRTQILTTKIDIKAPQNTPKVKRSKASKINLSERIFVIFSDIVYFLIVGVIFVELSLEYNFYEPRLYMFVAVLIGIILYCKTLHKLIAFLAKKVYNKYTKVKMSLKEYHERRKASPHSSGDNS